MGERATTPDRQTGKPTRRSFLQGVGGALLLAACGKTEGSPQAAGTAPQPTAPGTLAPATETGPVMNPELKRRIDILSGADIFALTKEGLVELCTVTPDLYDGTVEGFTKTTGTILSGLLSSALNATTRNAYRAAGGDERILPDGTDMFAKNIMDERLAPGFMALFGINDTEEVVSPGTSKIFTQLLQRSHIIGGGVPTLDIQVLPASEVTKDAATEGTSITLVIKDSLNPYDTFKQTVMTGFPKLPEGSKNREVLNPNYLQVNYRVTLFEVNKLGKAGARAKRVELQILPDQTANQ